MGLWITEQEKLQSKLAEIAKASKRFEQVISQAERSTAEDTLSMRNSMKIFKARMEEDKQHTKSSIDLDGASEE